MGDLSARRRGSWGPEVNLGEFRKKRQNLAGREACQPGANGRVGAELGAGLGLLDCPPGGRPLQGGLGWRGAEACRRGDLIKAWGCAQIWEGGHLSMGNTAGGAVAPGSLITLDEVRT